jgi:hypothetical protein
MVICRSDSHGGQRSTRYGVTTRTIAQRGSWIGTSHRALQLLPERRRGLWSSHGRLPFSLPLLYGTSRRGLMDCRSSSSPWRGLGIAGPPSDQLSKGPYCGDGLDVRAPEGNYRHLGRYCPGRGDGKRVDKLCLARQHLVKREERLERSASGFSVLAPELSSRPTTTEAPGQLVFRARSLVL